MINSGQFTRVASRKLASLAAHRELSRALRSAGLEHAAAIPAPFAVAERLALHDLAAAVPMGGMIVEAGSGAGAATCYLGAGGRPRFATLFCIDDWQAAGSQRDWRGSFEQFTQNTRPIADKIFTVRKDLSQVTSADLPPLVDLALLNGQRSDLSISAAWRLLAPLIALHGRIALYGQLSHRAVGQVLAEAIASQEWCVAGSAAELIWLRRARYLD